jgi:hypothetical protein
MHRMRDAGELLRTSRKAHTIFFLDHNTVYRTPSEAALRVHAQTPMTASRMFRRLPTSQGPPRTNTTITFEDARRTNDP